MKVVPAVKVGPICALVGAGGAGADVDTGALGLLLVCEVTALPATLPTATVPLLIPEMLLEIPAGPGLEAAGAALVTAGVMAGRVTTAAIVLPCVRFEVIAGRLLLAFVTVLRLCACAGRISNCVRAPIFWTCRLTELPLRRFAAV